MPEMPILLFAPLHKPAFGAAVGAAGAAVILAATVITLLQPGVPAPDLALLSQYFAGYTVSWPGAFIGAAWAGAAGFVAGWFLAFSRNLLITIFLFTIRTRAELDQGGDFLDHI